MKLYMKFYGNPSDSCWEVLIKTTNANLLANLNEGIQGSPNSTIYAPGMEIHPIVIEIFLTGSKWRTDIGLTQAILLYQNVFQSLTCAQITDDDL